MAVLTLSLFFIFLACKKNEKALASVDNSEKTMSIKMVDSVKVNDSIQLNDSLRIRYTSKLLVFPLLKEQKLLDSIYFINEGLKDYSKNGIQEYLEKQKTEYFNLMKKENKDVEVSVAQDWDTSFEMNLKSITNNYMHIEYLASSYEGGAHGNYGFSERVFDLETNRKMELKDITTMPEHQMETLLMKNINQGNSRVSDAEDKVDISDMLLVKVIPATNNFYFDDKNLYFHYSPYEIAAYAAGDIVIPISWEELKGTLVPEFKERMKIK